MVPGQGITRLYSTTGWPSRVCFTSESPGTRPEAAADWSTLVLTRRNSRVAVAPRISFARAVSLDTRQLNHDAVSALTLNQRLGDAQLVHTVTQDINVLR